MKRRKKRNKLIPLLIIITLVGAGAGVWYFVIHPRTALNNQSEQITYIVREETYTRTIEISGNVSPFREQDLAFPESGRITQISVSEGMYISPNQEVARLSTTQQEFSLAQTQNNLEEARIDGNQRTIELLELELEVREEALENRILRAPFGGLISSVDVEGKEWISPSNRIARIINTSSLTAEVEIDEMDASLIQREQAVSFIFDAYPDMEITGYISSLPHESRITSQGIAVMDTEVRIDAPPAEILPGFTFIGEIQIAEPRQVLLLPKEAVSEAGNRYVTFIEDENSEHGIRPVPIEVSEFDTMHYEVYSGLSPGDEVIAVNISPENSEGGRSSLFPAPSRGGGMPSGTGSGRPGGGMGGGR
ncbi:MAG: efflux RND transporter periplasmic adaptor subunit [Spirochaetia bacterium]